MSKINLLDSQISNMIAAGEVLERPASAVKELVENSIDAGASRIFVEVEGSGKKLIRIIDNGSGMDREDAKMAIIRHATSKIKEADDLNAIATLGFRGEALASICAVSKVEIITKTENEAEGTRLLVEGGEIKEIEDIGCNNGTIISISDLFFNTPARMKFMKSDSTEMAYITETMEKFIIANPKISFKLTKDGKEVFYSAGDNNEISNITNIYKSEIAKNLTPIDYHRENISITGFIGNNQILRNNRKHQMFFVNGRIVRNKIFFSAVDEALKERVVTSKYPFLILNINISTDSVDVNVHPTKAEVKFSDDRFIYVNIFNAISGIYEIEGMEEKKPQKEEEVFEPQSFIKTESFEEITPEPKLNVFSKLKFTDKPAVSGYQKVSAPRFEAVVPKMEETGLKYDGKISENREKELFSEEKEEKSDIQPEYIADYKIIGQLFDTYIVIEKDEKMYLMDQHAAHERLIFDRISASIEKGEKYSQPLITPFIYDVSPTEHSVIGENLDLFKKIGFDIELFTDTSIAVREIPAEIDKDDISDTVLEICENVRNNKVSVATEKYQRAVYTMACKAAIKANRSLTDAEIKKLVSDVLIVQRANTCPHGRPLFISYSKYEIEKQFKRA
ncbi:MAG: DNA mismatch repair endonuclease MutL [Clostridia bacterium]|nr:DNA mismatch repair endonuclease MutL [Clostridia bacterium]